MTSPGGAPAEVQRAQRVLTELGFLDPFGLVVASLHDDPIPERWRPLVDAVRDVAANARALLIASPPKLMVYGSRAQLPRPVTHAESGLVRDRLMLDGGQGRLDDPAEVREVARVVAAGKACLMPGIGVVVAAASIDDALFVLHSLERAATASLAAAALSGRGEPAVPTGGEIAAIDHDRRSGEGVQRVARRSFFDNFDPGGSPAVPSLDQRDARTMVAASCRVLAVVSGLVEFKEHVSMRDGDAFVMSPAASFAAMLPIQGVRIRFDDEASWEGAAGAPTRFRFYHRDLLAADVTRGAVVHTHGIGVDTVMLYGRDVRPSTRLWLPERPLPAVRPSMMFEAHDRAAALAVWGNGESVHITAHGTDYFTGDIRRATVAAIHHELAARCEIEGAPLGEPVDLPAGRIDWLRTHAPATARWWDHYAALADWSGWPDDGGIRRDEEAA